jgi:hypothetical protein
MEVANYALDEQHDKLLSCLNGDDDDETHVFKADQILADAIEAAISEARPLSEETITVQPRSATVGETSTIEKRVEHFKTIIKTEEAKIAKLTKEYDAVLINVADFVVNRLEKEGSEELGGDGGKVKNLKEQLEQEIEELGEEELQELEEEKRQDKQRKKKLLEALQGF